MEQTEACVNFLLNFDNFSPNCSLKSKVFSIFIQGVVEVLEKYSFTKNISFFITNGIMDNFLKLNDLMFQREDFCSSLMSKIQQNVLNGSGIFSKKYS